MLILVYLCLLTYVLTYFLYYNTNANNNNNNGIYNAYKRTLYLLVGNSSVKYFNFVIWAKERDIDDLALVIVYPNVVCKRIRTK